MEQTVEMASNAMIYEQSFMKIVTGLEGILSFCLRNLKGCRNTGFTGGSNLWGAPLKLSQVARYTYKVRRRSIKAIK
jgi:hypothetical protein